MKHISIFIVCLFFLFSCNTSPLDSSENTKVFPSENSLFLKAEHFSLQPEMWKHNGKEYVMTGIDTFQDKEFWEKNMKILLKKSIIISVEGKKFIISDSNYPATVLEKYDKNVQFSLDTYTIRTLELPIFTGNKKKNNDLVYHTQENRYLKKSEKSALLLKKSDFDTKGNTKLDELLQKSIIVSIKNVNFLLSPESKKAVLLSKFSQENKVTFQLENYFIKSIPVPLVDNFYEKNKTSPYIGAFTNPPKISVSHLLEGNESAYKLLEDYLSQKKEDYNFPTEYIGKSTLEKDIFLFSFQEYVSKNDIPPGTKKKLLPILENVYSQEKNTHSLEKYYLQTIIAIITNSEISI